jgi:type I restriction enzyme, S subunit
VVVKHATVTLADVLKAGGRLEATVFNIEARRARELIQNCKWGIEYLTNTRLVSSVSYPGRFKRNYVTKSVGKPFILPSQISEVNPQPTKWIYGIDGLNLSKLTPAIGDLLMTRSGTIGKCSFVGKTLAGRVMSDDLIRFVPRSHLQGYLYIFLTSQTGQLLLKTGNYGAVIQHIEPTHLEDIPVPIASDDIVAEIHEAIVKSFALRDESNALILSAQKSLIAELDLPPLEEIETRQFRNDADVVNFSVSVGQLTQRIDAT